VFLGFELCVDEPDTLAKDAAELLYELARNQLKPSNNLTTSIELLSPTPLTQGHTSQHAKVNFQHPQTHNGVSESQFSEFLIEHFRGWPFETK
jgi:hypothetical protein